MKDRWIRKHWEFQTVYREGVKQVGNRVILYARFREEEQSRFGIAVTKKLGKSVVRNRIKRRIREVIRRNAKSMGGGMDLVVVARKNILHASFEQIERDILALVPQRAFSGQPKRRFYGERP
jgi:ribonuclease P protein component